MCILKDHKIRKNVVTLVTQVLVDKDDPAFKNPTKPIGPYYSKEDAEKLQKQVVRAVNPKDQFIKIVNAAIKDNINTINPFTKFNKKALNKTKTKLNMYNNLEPKKTFIPSNPGKGSM